MNKHNAVDDEIPTCSGMIYPKLICDKSTADNANTERDDSISLAINADNQLKANAVVEPCAAVNDEHGHGSTKHTINLSACQEFQSDALAPVETPEVEVKQPNTACNVAEEVKLSEDVSVSSSGAVLPLQATTTAGNSE